MKLSVKMAAGHVVGYGLLWLWTIMMFYSTIPYSFAADPREALYAEVTPSLISMVVVMLVVGFVQLRQGGLSQRRSLVLGAAAAMALGSLLVTLGNPQEYLGLELLVWGGVLTGAGSGFLFVCWGERLAAGGSDSALLELSLGSCVAFLASFLLLAIPALAATALVAVIPFGSGVLLCFGVDFPRSCAREEVEAEGDSSINKQLGAGETAPSVGSSFSRQTYVLVARSLLGAAVIGLIAGFFDVVGGGQIAFSVDGVYGPLLSAVGFAATALLSLIAVVSGRDGALRSFRFSMLLVCLGCLLVPFFDDNFTWLNVLTLAGYTCFIITTYAFCIEASRGFRINVSACLGVAFACLYGGEVGGYLAGGAVGDGVDFHHLAIMTLVAVFLLFVTVLFLLTETNLTKLGIGEMNLPSPETSVGVGGQRTNADAVAIISARYRLTARESEVLPFLLEGRTIKRIQEHLFISSGTVSSHICRIYQKTGAGDRQELIDLAQQIMDEEK